MFQTKSIGDWQKEVHDNAREHGWWEGQHYPLMPNEILSKHMLMVTELAEATEEVRKGNASLWFDESGKPEGEAIELADVVIRIMDYFGFNGWDLEAMIRTKHEYNKTRPFRHGNKKA